MAQPGLLERFEHVAEMMHMPVGELAAWLEVVAAAGFAGREPSRLDERERAVLRQMEISDRKPVHVSHRASVRAMEIYIGLVEDSWSPSEVAEQLRCTVEEVRRRVEDRSFFAFALQQDVRLPSFQFVGHNQIPGLGRVLQHLPEGFDPLATLGFLNTQAPELAVAGRRLTPLEWLRSERPVAPVIAIAELLGVPA
ncbi:hypothetical protein [Lentzea sp.]|uniref:hypothetical protein n=1 Tax=Lentzea sp. TaxID=56099 RepID=UPI002ED50349